MYVFWPIFVSIYLHTLKYICRWFIVVFVVGRAKALKGQRCPTAVPKTSHSGLTFDRSANTFFHQPDSTLEYLMQNWQFSARLQLLFDIVPGFGGEHAIDCLADAEKAT